MIKIGECGAILLISGQEFRCDGGHKKSEYHICKFLNEIGSERVIHWQDPEQRAIQIKVRKEIPQLSESYMKYEKLKKDLEILKNECLQKWVPDRAMRSEIETTKKENAELKKENVRLKVIEIAAKRIARDVATIKMLDEYIEEPKS